MVSDFRKNKLLYVFKSFFDINGSGKIDKTDFNQLLERVSKVSGWKAGDEDILNNIWKGLQSADVDKDGEVSQDEWISLWESGSNAEWQNLYCKFIFQLEDSSNDGSIDSEEFSSVYAAFGLSKTEASAAFQKMSKGKASVSWTEFQDLWKEYFTTEDVNAPGNFIFGKSSW